MRLGFMLMIVVLCSVLHADTPDGSNAPKSAAAVAAMHKAELAQKAAQAVYDQAMFKAKKTEVDELRTALKITTQKGDLDEANAINAVLKSTQAELGNSFTPQSKASVMEGRWKMYDEAQPREFLITSNSVKVESDTGIPVVQGNVMIVKFPSGWTDRYTFEGDKLFKEDWAPGKSTDGWPDGVYLGVRDNANK
jgi:hypothetical protein